MLVPRDPAAATRAAVGAFAVASALTLGLTVLAPPASPVARAALAGVALGTAAAALLLARLRRAGRAAPSWVWAVVPPSSVTAIAGLDVATHDASAAGQLLLLLPVLVVSAHLRRTISWVTAALVVVGDAVVVLSLRPPAAALVDLAHVGGLALVMTALLVRSGERTDRLLATLRHQAAVDPLTGLVTRRVLDDATASALASGDADGGTALVIVDVDHFKSINDVHGHPVGDDALVHVGGLLRSSEPGAVVSRLGGDELALLLPGCTPGRAASRARHLAAVVRTTPLPLPDGALVPLTVSVGVAHAPQHATDVVQLYRAADAALYQAKRAGRDRARVAASTAVPSPREALEGPDAGRDDDWSSLLGTS